MLNRFQWMNELYPVGSKEILTLKASISFVDHLQEFLCAMLNVCTLVIPPFKELKDNPSSVVYFLQAYYVNRLTDVPSLMKAIVPTLRNYHELQVRNAKGSITILNAADTFSYYCWGPFDISSNINNDDGLLQLFGMSGLRTSTLWTRMRVRKIGLQLESASGNDLLIEDSMMYDVDIEKIVPEFLMQDRFGEVNESEVQEVQEM
ncbi:Putative acyl-activating enzyme 19 [Linum perenne]